MISKPFLAWIEWVTANIVGISIWLALMMFLESYVDIRRDLFSLPPELIGGADYYLALLGELGFLENVVPAVVGFPMWFVLVRYLSLNWWWSVPFALLAGLAILAGAVFLVEELAFYDPSYMNFIGAIVGSLCLLLGASQAIILRFAIRPRPQSIWPILFWWSIASLAAGFVGSWFFSFGFLFNGGAAELYVIGFSITQGFAVTRLVKAHETQARGLEIDGNTWAYASRSRLRTASGVVLVALMAFAAGSILINGPSPIRTNPATDFVAKDFDNDRNRTLVFRYFSAQVPRARGRAWVRDESISPHKRKSGAIGLRFRDQADPRTLATVQLIEAPFGTRLRKPRDYTEKEMRGIQPTASQLQLVEDLKASLADDANETEGSLISSQFDVSLGQSAACVRHDVIHEKQNQRGANLTARIWSSIFACFLPDLSMLAELKYSTAITSPSDQIDEQMPGRQFEADVKAFFESLDWHQSYEKTGAK